MLDSDFDPEFSGSEFDPEYEDAFGENIQADDDVDAWINEMLS